MAYVELTKTDPNGNTEHVHVNSRAIEYILDDGDSSIVYLQHNSLPVLESAEDIVNAIDNEWSRIRSRNLHGDTDENVEHAEEQTVTFEE